MPGPIMTSGDAMSRGSLKPDRRTNTGTLAPAFQEAPV